MSERRELDLEILFIFLSVVERLVFPKFCDFNRTEIFSSLSRSQAEKNLKLVQHSCRDWVNIFVIFIGNQGDRSGTVVFQNVPKSLKFQR